MNSQPYSSKSWSAFGPVQPKSLGPVSIMTVRPVLRGLPGRVGSDARWDYSLIGDRVGLRVVSVHSFQGADVQPILALPWVEHLSLSGIMSIPGQPDTPPSRPGVPLVDLTSGMFAAISIMAARCFA